MVSGGMASGIHYLGLLDFFDGVYGASAGSINGAFLVARQAPFGTTIYYENINNRDFIDLRRALVGRSVMSLEFLIDEVMTNRRVLDWRAVLASPVPLTIVASSITRRDVAVFRNFKSRDELNQAMRASARIPLIAGGPVSIGDERYLDAVLFEPIPYKTALTDGCTHVMVLRTRPLGSRLGAAGLFTRYVVAPQLERLSKGMGRVLLERGQRYNADLDFLEAANIPSGDGPYLYSVCLPKQAPILDRMETRRERLVAGAAAGMSTLLRNVGGIDANVIEVLQPFTTEGLGLFRFEAR